MTDFFAGPDGTPLNSLSMLNDLPQLERERCYRLLIADELLQRFQIDPMTLCGPSGDRLVEFDAPQGIGTVEVRVWHQLGARDPVLYFQLADTVNNQLQVLLFVINDPDAPRFDVDRDGYGQRTKFGTLTRNLEAECAAMQAGLAPGQIRRGLGFARKTLPRFEMFVSRLRHEMFTLEPLAYHTAILFESYGCAYSLGKKQMDMIHAEFQPGGELFKRLDGSTPFRRPGMEQTVRGRSWAIHDGILGEPFTNIRMYKRVGVEAGVSTFPNAKW